jgi:hypothetical protein
MGYGSRSSLDCVQHSSFLDTLSLSPRSRQSDEVNDFEVLGELLAPELPHGEEHKRLNQPSGG